MKLKKIKQHRKSISENKGKANRLLKSLNEWEADYLQQHEKPLYKHDITPHLIAQFKPSYDLSNLLETERRLDSVIARLEEILASYKLLKIYFDKRQVA